MPCPRGNDEQSTVWSAVCSGGLVEQEAREQGSLSRGEGTETGIRPHIYENHLTEVGDSDPCSAPQTAGVRGHFSPLPAPCFFVDYCCLATADSIFPIKN